MVLMFVDLLLIFTPIVGFCNCSMLCYVLLYVHSSFAIILMGKRELVALLSLSSCCLVIVVWLFLTVPRVCLQFVIVVFPDHAHYFCSYYDVMTSFIVTMAAIKKSNSLPEQYLCIKVLQVGKCQDL